MEISPADRGSGAPASGRFKHLRITEPEPDPPGGWGRGLLRPSAWPFARGGRRGAGGRCGRTTGTIQAASFLYGAMMEAAIRGILDKLKRGAELLQTGAIALTVLPSLSQSFSRRRALPVSSPSAPATTIAAAASDTLAAAVASHALQQQHWPGPARVQRIADERVCGAKRG